MTTIFLFNYLFLTDLQTDNGEEVEETAVVEKPECKPLPAVSLALLVKERENKLANRRQRIADICNSVMENPEQNVRNITVSAEMYEDTFLVGFIIWFMLKSRDATEISIPGNSPPPPPI